MMTVVVPRSRVLVRTQRVSSCACVGLLLALTACGDDDSNGGAKSDAAMNEGGRDGGDADIADGDVADAASQGDAGMSDLDAGPALPGALLAITFVSKAGVLLDEMPTAIRERVASDMLAKDDDFWVARAKRQLALATYRLNFRGDFYTAKENKKQLPLPPEELFEITVGRAMRTQIASHDYVLVDYTLNTTLLTDEASPTISEPMLTAVGETWDEPFVLPIDPEMLLQRTGYACMDESENPPNSVDSENVDSFYDQTCDLEDQLTRDGCHYTQLAAETCVDALDNHVGKIEAPIHYEWLPWDPDKAAQVRSGKVTNPTGSDLQVLTDELAVNRVTYRYIPEDSCALVEQCVGGSGFRRLLQFNASAKNVGAKPIALGNVDYFLDNPNTPTATANHHIYEYSACHMHYHFTHYGTFSYSGRTDLGSKRAFCLESSKRYANNERTPSWSDFNCHNQGISEGWGDEYNAGYDCQWVDVTNFDTSAAPITKPLGFNVNPDGFLCEGTQVLDSKGNLTWEPTAFKTDQDDTVDRPVCKFKADWTQNNAATIDVTLPVPGEGMVTSPCTRGQLGKLRNCGFNYDHEVKPCDAGTMVTLSCSAPAESAPQVVRVCEASQALGSGLACTDADALGAGETDIDAVSISFTCPRARDDNEPGGSFAVYTGPSYPADDAATVTCTVE